MDALAAKVGADNVKVVSIAKNNGVKREGVHFVLNNPSVSPIVYFGDVNGIYDDKHVDSFVQMVMTTYSNAQCFECKGMEKLGSWDVVKEYLRPRLINFRMNEQKLEHQPYVRILDLAVTFVLSTKEILPDYGDGVVAVSNYFMEKWEVSIETLYDQALMNMEQSGYSLKRIGATGDCLWMDGENLGDQNKNAPNLHMFTSYVVGGAVAMLSTKFLSEACKRMNYENLYILPSSIHEVLLVNCRNHSVSTLRSLVREVNENVVDSESFLSDEVYLFQDGELKIA